MATRASSAGVRPQAGQADGQPGDPGHPVGHGAVGGDRHAELVAVVDLLVEGERHRRRCGRRTRGWRRAWRRRGARVRRGGGLPLRPGGGGGDGLDDRDVRGRPGRWHPRPGRRRRRCPTTSTVVTRTSGRPRRRQSRASTRPCGVRAQGVAPHRRGPARPVAPGRRTGRRRSGCCRPRDGPGRRPRPTAGRAGRRPAVGPVHARRRAPRRAARSRSRSCTRCRPRSAAGARVGRAAVDQVGEGLGDGGARDGRRRGELGVGRGLAAEGQQRDAGGRGSAAAARRTAPPRRPPRRAGAPARPGRRRGRAASEAGGRAPPAPAGSRRAGLRSSERRARISVGALVR